MHGRIFLLETTQPFNNGKLLCRSLAIPILIRQLRKARIRKVGRFHKFELFEHATEYHEWIYGVIVAFLPGHKKLLHLLKLFNRNRSLVAKEDMKLRNNLINRTSTKNGAVEFVHWFSI